MQKPFGALGVALAVFAVASCATATNQNIPFERADSAPPGSANLYVYRTHAPPYIYRAEIYVNGQLVGKLPEGGYDAYAVPLGENEVVVKSFDWPDLTFSLSVEDSSDLFIRFTGGAFVSHDGSVLTMNSVAQAYLVESSAAVTEITGCCRRVRSRTEP